MREPKPLIIYTSLEYLLGFEDILSNLEEQTIYCEEALKKGSQYDKADYQRIIREGIKIAKENYRNHLQLGMSKGAINELEILDENI